MAIDRGEDSVRWKKLRMIGGTHTQIRLEINGLPFPVIVSILSCTWVSCSEVVGFAIPSLVTSSSSVKCVVHIYLVRK